MDVGDWLRSLGLGQYEATFRENEIDADVLPELTDADLEKLGVLLGPPQAAAQGNRRTEHAADRARSSRPAVKIAPKPHDAAERRQLTVMFCDLVGSTALSARLDPEDMRGIIAAYHKCCASLIERNGGFVAKYMGDGVLAYFGYPQAHEHDAERAVRAGLAIVEAAPKLETAAGAPLHVRVGIATGIVVVGDLLGSGEAQERGVVGDTPNLAARLQGIAEPDSVVIAEGTRKLLGDLFELGDLGPQDLKGVAGPTRAYAALRESSQESRFEALHAGGLTALVGREEESELLLRRWAKAKAGEGQVVLLSGEAGIGKSRLTAAFLERLAGEPHVRLRYFCSPQHTDSALYPIIGHMERAAGLAREDDAKTKLDKLDALLATSATSREDAALLAEMLSLAERRPLSRAATSPRSSAGRKRLEALIGQIEAICAPDAGADDLRGRALGRSFEPGSVRPARRQDRRLAGSAVRDLPAGIRRAVDRASACDGADDQSARRRAKSMALIDQVAGNRPLAANIRQDIVERADGIPLFVEEMTKAVLEAEGEGAAARTVASVPSPALAVPASLHASLMARLDRLGPAKAMAQIGAAIGREFSHALLACGGASAGRGAGGGARPARSRPGCSVRQGAPPHATYLFKHASCRTPPTARCCASPAARCTPGSRKRLESQFPDIAENQPELLARHCTEAGLIEKAARPLGQGGTAIVWRARRSVEAEAQLTRALDRDRRRCRARRPCVAKQIKLQVALVNALMHAKGYAAPETKASFDRARSLIEHAEALGEPPEDPLGAVFGSLRLLGRELYRVQRRRNG